MATAVVTGCSTGSRFATALRLAEIGFDVVATMREPERDGGALRAVAAHAGVQLQVARLDVTDDGSVEQAFAEISRVDVLVNNAGVGWFGSVEETGIDHWHVLFDTNVFGAVRCMRAALPAMRTHGGGCIVNVSSFMGAVSLPAAGAYAASKAALASVSETMAIEGRAHGIRVVIIETGATDTQIGAKVKPPSRDSPYWSSMRNTLTFLAAQTPLGSPSTVADAIALAVSEPSTRLRVAAGNGSAEIIRMRRGMTDEEWISTLGGPTAEFMASYQTSSRDGGQG